MIGRWPVRLILVGIVFALTAPALVFFAVLLSQVARVEHRRLEQAALSTASRVADALDRELGNLSATLVTLATSPALDGNDLAAFDHQARVLARVLGQAVVLSAPNGQQMVNTRLPFGERLPKMGSMPAVKSVLQSRRGAVSGLFVGAASGGPSVAVIHPVLRGDTVVYLLAISLQPAYLNAVLKRQGLPPEWSATVADSSGQVLARTERPGLVIGSTIPVEARRPAGEPWVWEGDTLEGAPALAAGQWLGQADWRVGLGIPWHVIQAPLRSTIVLLGVTGVLSIGLAVLLAVRLAASIGTPLQLLARAGAALGQCSPPVEVRSRIAEVHAVARALTAAHEAATHFTEDLEHQVAARTAELEDANRRLRDAIERGAKAEEQLRQAQKMEAVGQLTGGIAHDFNNLLTVVIGSLDLLRRRAPDDRQRRLIDNAMDGANRATTLVARLLAFSRRHPLQPQAVDVNHLVAGMSELLRRTLGEAVSLETVLAGGVWPTLADPNQLENALLNLAVNGRDALAAVARNAGGIVIETGNVTLDHDAMDPDLEPGAFVALTVRDNGGGMSAETVARVFEPFFTTKPPGQGTGLGLSQVHGFVKQSGGQVRIRTTQGEGTAVTIFLPRFEGAPDAPAQTADQDGTASANQVVLLVEDDGNVRRYSVEALRDLGCTVLEADSGAQALRLLDAHPEVALLLTDVVMPGMSGPALAERARHRRPDLHVLFASGLTGVGEPAYALPEGAMLLSKPFTVQTLGAKLRELAAAG